MGGCYSLRKYISDFWENKLEPELRTTMENHLKLCPKCQRSVKSLSYLQEHLSHPPGVHTHAGENRFPDRAVIYQNPNRLCHRV